MVAIEMVGVLSRRSARFKALWDAHDVRRAETDILEVVLPGGRLTLTLVTLQGVTSPGVRFNATCRRTPRPPPCSASTPPIRPLEPRVDKAVSCEASFSVMRLMSLH